MLRSIDKRTWAIWLAAFVVLALAGCAGIGGGGASTTPGPEPTGAPLTQGELRLRLIEELGPLWYCDRDEYPVGRDELEGMRETWPQLIADADLAGAVLASLDFAPLPAPDLTDDQRLRVYRLWKAATAVQLESIGNDRWRFDYLAQPAPGAIEGRRMAGVIDSHGAIKIEQEAAAGEPMCPICLSVGTLVDAPDGGIAVDRLRIGDTVWTLDRDASRVRGTVIALGSTPAPSGHRVIRLTLTDGRAVSASPGHPLADGRTFAELSIGDAVDGSVVAALDTIRYEGDETFDLVVSGQTGIYFAGGIPLGSTLD